MSKFKKYIDLTWEGVCYNPEESENQLGKPQIKKLERNFTMECKENKKI